jgi:hypothetical protein
MTLCKCHGCGRQIPPRLLMCERHWSMVPLAMKKEVWKHYRQGQEYDGKGRTQEYDRAAIAAIEFVLEREKNQRLAAGAAG